MGSSTGTANGGGECRRFHVVHDKGDIARAHTGPSAGGEVGAAVVFFLQQMTHKQGKTAAVRVSAVGGWGVGLQAGRQPSPLVL